MSAKKLADGTATFFVAGVQMCRFSPKMRRRITARRTEPGRGDAVAAHAKNSAGKFAFFDSDYDVDAQNKKERD
jgi:hypothetical protein